MGTFWLARGYLGGDGILRGAGQSRHQAMRCNARVAFVFGGGAASPGTKRPLITRYAAQTKPAPYSACGLDLVRHFDLAASCAGVKPDPLNQTLARELRYVLIIGSKFGGAGHGGSAGAM